MYANGVCVYVCVFFYKAKTIEHTRKHSTKQCNMIRKERNELKRIEKKRANRARERERGRERKRKRKKEKAVKLR